MSILTRSYAIGVCTALALLSAIGSGNAGAESGDDTALRDSQNKIVLVRQVKTEAVWNEISGVIKENELKGTRFLIPVKGKSRLYPYFMNLNNYPDHNVVLKEFFPGEFADITYDSYVTMAIDPARRIFYSGNITERSDNNGKRIFSYTIWHHVSDPKKALRREEIEQIYSTLTSLFTLGPLEYDPFSKNQRDIMKNWGKTSFPVFTQDELLNGYEAYTTGEAYGIVRFLTLAGFENGVVSGKMDYRDIIVIDSAPFDVVPVVSGIVTGTRQGELSHLNVRFANRHIANCHIADPFRALREWEGRLVHLKITGGAWEVSAAGEEDARKWWNTIKPAAVTIAPADRDFKDIMDLTAIPVGSKTERAAAVQRFGSKAAQLAVLYSLMDNTYEVRGFAVPAAWYFDFMKNNGWSTTLGGKSGFHSFEETVNGWLADEKFLNDPNERARRLALLRQAMSKAKADPALLAKLRDAIKSVFRDETVMLRLRSSSNAEDSVFFSGAGLYESATACIADDFDKDDIGPSRGDPQEKKEKTAAAALMEVWASLWNTQAVEDRLWYSIDQRNIGMAVLVNARSKAEKANMVVFTGNPGIEDDRYLFNAQAGDVDAVRTYGGVYPEKAFVTVTGGKATNIERVSFSNVGKYDLYILAKEQIEEISAVLWKAARDMPVDFAIPDGCTLLWDTEWKITSDNRLMVKQIRPFLRADKELTGLR